MKADVLAVGAHPDDIELACGGTVARLVQQGYTVALVDVTQGERGTRGNKEVRAKEAEDAAGIMGVARRQNLQIPDGGIEINDSNTRKLITVIRELQPSMMLIPYGVERHPDHVHTHQLCREAWYYSGLRKLTTTLDEKEQLPHRPNHYFEFMQWHEFQPSFIMDITSSFEIKMKAIRAHRSQFFDPSSNDPETKLSRPEFLHSIETRSEYYGQKIGVQYGEPFVTNYSIGVKDLFDLVIHKG